VFGMAVSCHFLSTPGTWLQSPPEGPDCGGESRLEINGVDEGLAGAAGFEPANAGTKNRCLTTWRRPSMARVRPYRPPRLMKSPITLQARLRTAAGIQPSVQMLF
jgi:hypothetical protein